MTSPSSQPETSAKMVSTSYLLSNMHCPSCVSHIQNILYSLDPKPASVSPSLVSHWVTVEHPETLLPRQMSDALEDAGFDVCNVSSNDGSSDDTLVDLPLRQDGENGYLDQALRRWRSRSSANSRRERQSHKHVENCKQCRLAIEEEQEASTPPPKPILTQQQSQSSSETDDNGKKLPLVVVDTGSSQDIWRASLAIGGMTCASCAGAITKELQKKDWVQNVVVNLIANSATVDFRGKGHEKDIAETIEDIGYDAALDSVVDLKEPTKAPRDTWRASLAIGGMTCASCSGAITKELQKKDWVQKVVVNLIANSATVDFYGKEHKQDIVDAIEDIGYDATLDTVVELKESTGGRGPRITKRTVDIRVDGMFCEHCPPRVIAALESFGDRIQLEKSLTTHDPIVRLSYTPEVPKFTIRHIMSAISAADESLQPSIYHPPTLEERSRQIHQREQQRLLIRVILTFIIAIPTLIIGIVFMSLVSAQNPGRKYLDAPLRAGVSRSQWALFILATPVYFLCADVFHKRAIKEMRSLWRRGNPTPIIQRFYRFGSMNSLMSLGTTIAYVSSVAQLIAAGVHPSEMADNNSFYFDSVVFLTFFLLIGRLIEAYSKSKTGDAVAMLGKLRPTTALLLILEGQAGDARQAESLETVEVDLLEFGDTVKVLHGGSPPCDGTVVQGETKFDESSLTGESRPVKKSVGDQVFSGTVNEGSPVSIEITGVAGSSMLDQIVKAVREGQTRRAPMERIADTLTSYFVPMIVLIAIFTWIIWLSLGISGALPQSYMGTASGGWVAWALQFSIAVFVVACPCGLALAAPTALFVGGGLAAKHGILVKGGGEAFERASKLDCIVFDKTGTLTMGGEPVVTDFEFPQEIDTKSMPDEKTILAFVSALEGNSSHTVAKAIVSFCKDRELRSIDFDQVDEIPGKGMKASYTQEKTEEFVEVIVGNEALMSESLVSISDHTQGVLDSWKTEGKSVVLAAMKVASGEKWHLCATFAISDPIRPEAPGIVSALQARGTQVWMLSGDNQLTASAIGALVGIPATNIIAGVLPSQKAEKIQYLQKSLKSGSSSTQRALVAMVGDGINDSPALTTADVGIAIGSGSDIAISSASFVLITSNLNCLITLLDLSRFVFRRIKFNFGWALIYNMIALPVAAGVLYPVVSNGKHVRLDPVWASLAMALSSISVVCSSLALRSKLPGIGFRAKKVE
ncbi:HAD-like protein [Coleophoma crateriformis]|uniref:HAD-like protein n=1 Tax=Coleophoma crateriformis TaxID=565419 RepID=A0A3D8SH09_9HELO|nr:HAD-like protein [Coleophoma crateriformis]